MITLFNFRDWCRNFLQMPDYEVYDTKDNREITLD